MNTEQLRDYCLSKLGVTESLPFDEYTLVFKVMGKIFAIVPLERIPTQVNLKCDPERAIELREQFPDAVFPGYHMSQKHWNTVYAENNIPPKLFLEMVDHSYELIVQKLPKKLQEELRSLGC